MVRVRHFTLLFFVTLLSLISGTKGIANSSYDFTNIDSLLVAISKQPDDSFKVQTIISASKALYKESKYNKAISLCEKSLNIAKNISYPLGEAESYFLMGRANNKLNNSATALELFNDAQGIFQEQKRIDRLASLYNNVGLIYKNLGRFSNAVQFLSRAYEYYQRLENRADAARVSNNLGSVYMRLGNHEKAAAAYFESLKFFEELEYQMGIAGINSNLALLFSDQKEYERALKHSRFALKIFEELGEKQEHADLLNNIAEIHINLREPDKALTILNKCLKLYSEINYPQGIASTLDNTGIVHAQKGEYQKAYDAYEKALQIFIDLDQMGHAPGVYNNMAHTLIMMERYQDALDKLEKGLSLSEEIGLQDAKLESYQRYHELYEKKNDHKTSLSYFKQYSLLKDSLFNKNKTQQLAYIEESYEIEKRERENQLLRQQQATKDEVIKRQTLQVKMLIGGVITFLLFAIYYYRINQQKKKTNELLSQQNEAINQKQKELLSANQSLQISELQLHETNQELQSVNSRLETTVKKRTSELQRTNQELDTFLYQSSHALRRPIVHVKGLVQLARIEPDPQEVVGLYDKLDDTATRMDLMLKKLVMASEIYVTKPEVDQIDFEQLIREVWDSLTDTLKAQSVSLEYTIPKKTEFRADRKLIKVMFLNLLENAIFYNEATKRRKATVTIGITSNPKSLDIKVNDNGIGISEESIASIFDLFSVGTDKTRGYGLGLYIVKKAVEKLQGVITVSSKRNEFTTFHITLPKEV